MSKMGSVHAMECYSDSATVQKDFEDLMVGKTSQAQRKKIHGSTYKSLQPSKSETESRVVCARGWGSGQGEARVPV